ncbi:hypothetical protein [Streptomyces sp. V1I6]|uniref:hypothetical protein n=1 Tax=Streptomyces sp. V1I6 TaxID=3042273 RepID=UPI002780494C|nr:hypothetical protein [Streptomyces sp. V1I6]MDQ0847020.1 hypothetical protein [Streptomyces sp. V1I6]
MDEGEDGSLREVVRGRDLPLRFALVSEEWDGEQTVWARCVDVDGLFMDRAAFRERLTLLGCAATGRLLKAAERCARNAPVPFGELHFTVHDVDAEDPYTYDYCALDDVVVIDSRPSAEDPRLLDLVVECVVTDGPPGYRKEPARTDVALLNGTSGGPLGHCRRVEGAYGDRPDPPARTAHRLRALAEHGAPVGPPRRRGRPHEALAPRPYGPADRSTSTSRRMWTSAAPPRWAVR